MKAAIRKEGLCGVWVSPDGVAHLSYQEGSNARSEVTMPFTPFIWAQGIPDVGLELEVLHGEGEFKQLVHCEKQATAEALLKEYSGRGLVESVKPYESQFLLQHALRQFGSMNFGSLRRCQIDIETYSSVAGSFCNARRAGDRILAIGFKCQGQSTYLVLEELTDVAERKLLKAFNTALQEMDPDIIEGHNFFKFDLQYLKLRCARYNVPCVWGRFGGQLAEFRNSRFKVAERWIDFPRCDIPGRAVFDTYLMVQLYDVTQRELPSYGLKAVARHLGITDEKGEGRTYLEGDSIQEAFESDRDTFLTYLEDDLRETAGVADLLLPTYLAQVQNLPMALQEATLRGTGNKIDLLFLEKYYQARHALPVPKKIGRFEGGFTKSYEVGVFQKVLNFDVASLYPSLMVAMSKNPKSDTLQCFIATLQELRTYRLEYKKKAKLEKDEGLRLEYEARQQSFKVLINSFYGYLGFEGARFSDGDLAAEVTRQGRELLQKLIEKFQEIGCKVLEADTDGMYVHCPEYFERPLDLLDQVTPIMPAGVELEFSGAYEAMFSYKAKNYALREGDKVIIRGSALRSRGTEPFLRELTDCMIYGLLGMKGFEVKPVLQEMRKKIALGIFPVDRLARMERLSQKPEVYKRAVDESQKPRRAALEVALKMDPIPGLGDPVTYFITKGAKAKSPDWQVARSVDDFDSEKFPYDPTYYLRKLDDWQKRYAEFLD